MTCGSCRYEWCWICGLGMRKSRLCPLMEALHFFCDIYIGIKSAKYVKSLVILTIIFIIVAPALAILLYCLGFIAGILTSIGFSAFETIKLLSKSFKNF